jgi:hypothetical protein
MDWNYNSLRISSQLTGNPVLRIFTPVRLEQYTMEISNFDSFPKTIQKFPSYRKGLVFGLLF